MCFTLVFFLFFFFSQPFFSFDRFFLAFALKPCSLSPPDHLCTAGFFDPTQDEDAAKQGEFRPVSRTEADGKEAFDTKEQRARRDDKKKMEERMKKDLPGAIMQMNKMSDLFPSRKRSKLVLPEPQVRACGGWVGA